MFCYIDYIPVIYVVSMDIHDIICRYMYILSRCEDMIMTKMVCFCHFIIVLLNGSNIINI